MALIASGFIEVLICANGKALQMPLFRMGHGSSPIGENTWRLERT